MLFPQQCWPEDTEQIAQLQTGSSSDVTQNIKTDIWENGGNANMNLCHKKVIFFSKSPFFFFKFPFISYLLFLGISTSWQPH